MSRLLSLLEHEKLAHPGASDEVCVRAIAARLIDESGIAQPPVDVGLLASVLDISEIVRARKLDVPGCLLCGPKRSTILVRADDPVSRQRFTICHECAHTFFPGFQYETRFRCAPTTISQADGSLEQLCDVAAGELLLPRRMIAPRVQSGSFSLETVVGLAADFSASLAATAIAYVSCSTQPTAVLIFEVMQKPTEYGTLAPRRLRLKAAVRSGSWPFFRRHKSASVNDPFDRANQGEIVSESGMTLRGVVGSPVVVDLHAQPFPYFDGTDRRDRVIALLRRSSWGATVRA